MRTTEMSMEKMIKGLQMVRSNHEDEVMVSLEHGEIGVFDLVHNVILALGKTKALSPVEPDGKDINVTTTDTISRQAAMDICDTFNGQGSVWAVIKGYIKALPPVEQKQEGMTVEEYRQRMMDAFHNADCGELIALVVLPSEKEFEHLEWLLEKHYKAKPEQKQGWIPVSERLPEEDGEYLVTVKPTFKNMRNYIKHCDFALNLYLVDEYDFVNKKGVAGFYKYDSEYGYYEVTEVIAWCELPEPYKMCGGEE